LKECRMTPEQKQATDLRNGGMSWTEVGRLMGISGEAARSHAKRAKKSHAVEMLSSSGYDLNNVERTPEDAWRSHVSAFERKVGKTIAAKDQVIKRTGPFVIFHATDEHIDDDASALN